MSEAKWTPEPWEVGQYDWLIQEFEKDGEKGEIAQVNVIRPHFGEYEANAQRIVAVVNALARRLV